MVDTLLSAKVMARERTRAVCDGLRAALASYGTPEQILTDNGKVFTGRFFHPPVKDQPKHCQPSPEAEMSSISRGHTSHIAPSHRAPRRQPGKELGGVS